MTTTGYSRHCDGPDRVWITYGGGCFHTTPACPALAEGQAKARSAGYQPWRVVSASLERARGRRACRVCHGLARVGGWSDTDDGILRAAHAKGRGLRMIAGMLDRTEQEVCARLAELGLPGPPGIREALPGGGRGGLCQRPSATSSSLPLGPVRPSSNKEARP